MVTGCPKKLTDLIRSGKYDPDKVNAMTTSQMKVVCEAAETKLIRIYTLVHVVMLNVSQQPQMLVKLEALHSHLLQGKSECHVFAAAPSCSGGKVF